MDDLIREEARLDAAYREKKDSKKPALEGALKGGLASGLIARIVKPKLRRTEAGLIGSGTVIGGAIGHSNHNNSIDRKRKANRLLKDASVNVADYGNVAHKHTNTESGGGATDAIMGAVAGGALSAIGAGKIPRGKWAATGAIGGAISGYASGKVGDYISRKNQEHNDNQAPSMTAIAAAGGVIDGAISPVVSKAIGTRTKKDGDFYKGVKNAYDERKSSSLYGKIMGAGSEERAILDGADKKKGDRFFNKKTLKASGAGMIRNGLTGGAIGYGIDRLGKYLTEKNRNQ